MRSDLVSVRTGRQLVTDITGQVSDFARRHGDGACGRDGLLNVFLPHATAGLAVIETGSGTEPDIAAAIDRSLPADDRYVHFHGTLGHGRDHVLPAFISPSVTLPVVDGQLALGRWQSLVIVDTNVDNHTRSVRLSFIPG